MVQVGLVCDVRRVPDAMVVVARGELDMDSSGVLEKAFDEALEPVPAQVVLDFSAMTFCDSVGMSALVRLFYRVEQAGSRLVIDRPTRQVARLFTVTGLDSLLTIQDSDSNT